MFLTRKPSSRAMDAFLAGAGGTDFSYAEVGATRDAMPSGYSVDHHRIRLGQGDGAFARALICIRAWRMFQTGWLTLTPHEPPIHPGATVAILVRAFGLWSLHACRIVYVIDERDPIRRFGFAYGTLTDHAESGEERFSIEWRREDDSVWYEIVAFSRPAHWIARFGYPVSRRLQRRFARDSMRAMARCTAST